MTKLYAVIFSLCSFIFIQNATAQITVGNTTSGTLLAQTLAGNGVTILNVTMNCPTGHAGTFAGNSSIGIGSGIVLSTGFINTIHGPNDSTGTSGGEITNLGDADLDAFSPGTTSYDACILEFDMKVLSDSVEFKYVFGSEEYPEYVCSAFNDVFGFFISGPNIATQNIALIPGTGLPVAINTVNPGVAGANSGGGLCTSLAYSTYYVDNGDGTTAPQNVNPYYIQYDGLTKVLTAKIKGLAPCDTYHLKLAIQDFGDWVYDSGVFLEANSLTSNSIAIDSVATDVPDISDAVEGCVNGTVRLHLSTPLNINGYIHYKIGGSATNGVDYSFIADSILLPAGDTMVTIRINPFLDAINEDSESVKIYLINCDTAHPYDSAVLWILDSLQVRVSADASICIGDSVQLLAVGANKYVWTPALGLSDDSIPDPVAIPLVTTTYVCKITVGQCSNSDSVTITVIPPPYSVNAGPDLASCTQPSVTIQAGVTGPNYNGNPFVYSWTPTTGLSNTNTLSTVASPPSPTTYILSVISGTCVVRDTVNVVLGGIQITDTVTHETCFGFHDGRVAVTSVIGTPPYTYSWNNGTTATSQSNLAGGTYLVTVTDSNSCSASASMIVVAATPISVNAGQDVIECTNPSVTINAVVTGNPSIGNPFVYSWTPATGLNATNILTPSASPSTPTDYVIQVSTGICKTTDTIRVAIGNLVLSSSSTNETCYGYHDGTVSVSVTIGSAPYGYLWSTQDSVTSLNNLPGGNYFVTVTDAFGCTATASPTVVGVTNIILVNAGTDTIDCVNPSVQLNGVVTGNPVNGNPFVYSWSPAAGINNTSILNPDASPASPTDYVLLVTTGICNFRDTVHVVISSIAANTTSTNETCFGFANGTGTVAVSAGVAPFTYLWSGNGATTATASNLGGGNYTVTVVENFGCSTVSSVTIVAANAITFSIPVVKDVLCFGEFTGSISLTASGGAGGITYLWDDQNQSTTSSISTLNAGPYTVTVTDANACTAEQSYIVNQSPILATTTTTIDARCYQAPNGSAITVPTGGTQPYAPLWSNGATTTSAYGLVAGTYTCTVTDQNGCSVTTTGIVNEPSDLTYTITVDAVKCIGDANGVIYVAAQGGTSPYNYSATQDMTNFLFAVDGAVRNLAIGTYIVIISDDHGCTKVDTTIVPDATPDVFITTTDSTSCFGSDYNDGAAHILAISLQNSPYEYSIDGGAGQFSGDFYLLSAGDHFIHAVNYHGCKSDTTVSVLEPLPVLAEINIDTLVLRLGETKQIQVLYQNVVNPTFNWTPAEGLSCIDCANPWVSPYYRGDYTVTVSVVNHNATCYTSASVHVEVEPHKPVFIPNSFSPNGDGNNDLFMIYGEDIKFVDLKIFNRWGELVYKANNQLAGWDGTYKGEMQLPNVFTYTAKITFLDDKTFTNNGTVTLIR